ncbi:MAG: GerMN domain-containing protein [Clostridia bacterium]|nr:GerMN domain-containing protein [Clostridia bacterium]
MKKAIVCVVLTLVFCVVSQRQVRQSLLEALSAAFPQRETESEEAVETPNFTEQLGSREASDMLDVTLYFRFGQTSVLGAQQIQLDIRREETIAMRIVQQLVEGPGVSRERLSGVFPQGTQVLSVSGDGTTAFVTLSMAFLGKPDGAPSDWEDLTEWQEEAALRRRLAVQSVVLALTEEGRYQRVQLYVAQSDDDIPQRIPMALLDTEVTDASIVLAAGSRDEQALLTPQRAMRMIMDAWQEHDWETLYTLMAPAQEEPLPTFSVFEAQMKDRDVTLLDYEVSVGTVSIDGSSATLVLDAGIRSDGGDVRLVREVVPLTRWADNWAMTTETLRSLMIRD